MIDKVVQNIILHILVLKINIFDHLTQDNVSNMNKPSFTNFFLAILVDFGLFNGSSHDP